MIPGLQIQLAAVPLILTHTQTSQTETVRRLWGINYLLSGAPHGGGGGVGKDRLL